jgi:hypothetical protein
MLMLNHADKPDGGGLFPRGPGAALIPAPASGLLPTSGAALADIALPPSRHQLEQAAAASASQGASKTEDGHSAAGNYPSPLTYPSPSCPLVVAVSSLLHRFVFTVFA